MNFLFLKKPSFGFLLFAVLFLTAGFGGNVFAQKVRLRAQITPTCATSSNAKFADIYAAGNIAVQGSYNCRGAFIYDISNPDAPVLAAWYNPGANQQFLEAVVIGNRGYFGSGNGGGVHIVDLTNPYSPQLLGIVNAANGNGHNSIHEMVVFGNYLIENFNGFSNKILKVINISNPAIPVFVRDMNPTETIWVHAMHIRGNRLFTSGWGSSSVRGRTEIYDIANIGTQAPTLLGFIEDTSATTAGNSMHSSWSSEDGNYLYSCRETSNGNADLRTYNISNPAQPLLVNRIGMNDLALNATSPHNPVVMGNFLYVAWYEAGTQIFDISNPAAPRRVGQYDSYQAARVEPDASKTLIDEPWDMVCGIAERQGSLPTGYDGNWAVFPFLGQDKVLMGDLRNGLLIVDAMKVNQTVKNRVSDFDGDGKTDFSTYTPNSGLWQIENSSNNAASAISFGAPNDKIVSGDYDNDGKSDVAVFRPSTGIWYILGSTAGFRAVPFGVSEDLPMAADFDADGKTDIAVFRPSTGIWYIQQSIIGFRAVRWGASGDKVSTGDYDGDGKADLVAFRPSTGIWYIFQSSSTLLLARQFGLGTDKPLSGDFDGDGKFDYAVFRPSDNNWYVLNSQTNALTAVGFGASTDIPIPADYDGDGKADVAVFRPENNSWYRLNSTSGTFIARVFGQNGDLPSPTSAQP
ncbi:MAG: FG-GAP-like repeat-containing protein [Pyrinomonadaceae bacterium]|nr:FG-GAP-like repeat-containing protein [Pyrinomonadaceae bacterium]